MNRTKTTLAGLLGILLLTAAVGPAAAASDKPFAVIDSQRIVDEYSAAKDAQEQYQRFLQDKEQEIVDMERDLQLMAEAIESQKMLLGEDALRTKVEEFESEKQKYFNLRESIDSQAEEEYKKKIQPIIDQVKLIVDRIGKEEGYGIVIDAAGLTVLYLDADVDLTDKVIETLVRGVEE
jgi:outer membrane protein